MKKFTVFVDTYACVSYEIEAENRDEAEDKVQEKIDSGDFFEEYRKSCDFFEPTIGCVMEE